MRATSRLHTRISPEDALCTDAPRPGGYGGKLLFSGWWSRPSRNRVQTSMTGPKVLLRATARRLAAATLVLGLLVTFASTPSQASLKSRLHDAKARLSALTSKIKLEETQASALGSQLAAIDQRIAAAATRSAAIDAELASTRTQIAAAQTQYDALQAQLDQIARNAYEQGSAGPLATFLTAVLGSSSMGELSDRLQSPSQA